MSDLTRPENCAERRDRKRILGMLAREGGCTYCKARETAWGKAYCPLGQTFPLCTKKGGPFELDHEAIAGADDDR